MFITHRGRAVARSHRVGSEAGQRNRGVPEAGESYSIGERDAAPAARRNCSWLTVLEVMVCVAGVGEPRVKSWITVSGSCRVVWLLALLDELGHCHVNVVGISGLRRCTVRDIDGKSQTRLWFPR